ncbi:MAG: hypothetical protein EOP83_31360, partial [Verrucomicrobiaceae bacterium]
MTFDLPSFLGGTGAYRPYMEEQNFRLSSNDAIVIEAPDSNLPSNGTNHVRSSLSEANITVQHREGLPFDLASLDLAEYSTVFPSPKSVTFTGYKVGGGTVSHTVVTDGVIDGTGPLNDFQTFAFPASFTNLSKVVANMYLFRLDNIAVVVDGQETPPPPPPAPPLIYDVTWDAPIHTVGQVTAVGGAYSPTTINFGTPTVRQQLGTMAGPALEFKGTGYQQLQFKAKQYARAYRVEFDAYLDLPVEFSVLFDGYAPIQRVDFKEDGTIGLFQSGIGSISSIGSYPQRETMQVAIDVDMIGKTWAIFVNGERKHLGPFGTADGDLLTIRLHESGSTTGFAGLDNVRIFAYDPGTQAIPGPRIAASPEKLDFPQVTVGTGKTWLLYVRNGGGQNL